MPNLYSIKVHQYEGRLLTDDSLSPADTEDEAKTLFDKKVAYWLGEKIGGGRAVTIILQCNEPVHIVEQKTLRG